MVSPSSAFGDGRENAYTVGIRANPDVEKAFEKQRAQHLADLTGEIWVVVSTSHPRGGFRLWTWRRSILEICSMNTPTKLVFTAQPVTTWEGH